VVENATLPTERCLAATLATLPALAEAEKVRPPALIMVGQVVQLHPLLSRPGIALQAQPAAPEAPRQTPELAAA
jgi:uroporphyrin-III C-methyltransferase